ncbi:MAG TPA: hypothetical protein VMT78_08115, partial [Terriglobia bacterium]|nr:hypothetical protein [Terriglobia bacterium]
MNLDSEAPVRRLSGAQGALGWVLATGLSVYSLVWVITIVEPQIYRVSFLLLALILTFLLYPARQGQQRVSFLDWLMIAATLVAFVWPLMDFREFVYRAAEPGWMDLIGGTLA